MAHITQIFIEGLLGRDKPINLKLNREVNIFFGENGCGKTTLLKILDAALSRDGSAMDRLPVQKATIDIYSITDDRIIRHTWERKNPDQTKQHKKKTLELLDHEYIETSDGQILIRQPRHENDWRLSPAERPKSTGTRWAHTFLPTTRLYFNESTRVTPPRAQLSETELDKAFSDSVNRAWLQFYSKTLSEVRNIQEGGLRAVLRYVLNPAHEEHESSSENISEIYGRVASFLAKQPQSVPITLGSQSTFQKRYESDSNLRKIVDNLDQVERSIERAMVPVNRFLETITHLFSRGKKLSLTDNELQVLLADDRVLPISQLSSGEKHLIKILLSSMTAGPNTVLIDEPELSMHIDWQRLFVKTITSLNPRCQLILASHSPEVMGEVDDERIFRI